MFESNWSIIYKRPSLCHMAKNNCFDNVLKLLGSNVKH